MRERERERSPERVIVRVVRVRGRESMILIQFERRTPMTAILIPAHLDGVREKQGSTRLNKPSLYT